MGTFQLLFLTLSMIIPIFSCQIQPVIDFNEFIAKNESIKVTLTPVKTFLANENLPVWIVDRENPDKSLPLTKVMKNIGPFTMYWDQFTCTAAVYYHAKDDFDVYIGHHRVLRKSVYNSMLKKMILKIAVMEGHITTHNEYIKFDEKFTHPAEEVTISQIPSRVSYPKRVYVESLVIVDHTIAEYFEYSYAAVVTYVLGQFNMVDMLYSKIKKPNMRINIAGILIGTEEGSFPLILKCHDRGEDDPNELGIETRCTFNAISLMLFFNKNFQIQNYDNVIFITRKLLFRDTVQTSETGERKVQDILWGINGNPASRVRHRDSSFLSSITLVGGEAIYGHFITIAHEMAHEFGATHDSGPVWDEDGACGRSLMKRHYAFCSRCMRFSETTSEQLENFFGLTSGCIYRNEPKSLRSPKQPQKFWSREEQCLCYGYAGQNPEKSLWKRYVSRYLINCNSKLKCLGDDNVVYSTAPYMNGTPCDRKEIGTEVCWNSECLPTSRSAGS